MLGLIFCCLRWQCVSNCSLLLDLFPVLLIVILLSKNVLPINICDSEKIHIPVFHNYDIFKLVWKFHRLPLIYPVVCFVLTRSLFGEPLFA